MPRSRFVRIAAALAATTLVAVACSGPERPTAPTNAGTPAGIQVTGVNTQILDATNSPEPHFYWLPPIAPSGTYPGTFDGAVNPELRLCRLTAGTCATPLIATYTRSTNPAITVSSTAKSYSLDWTTKPASITSGDYRAEVWVKGRRLGLADARVVDNAKDLKNVPAGFVGVQKGKSLTFAFRLELGIVGSITVAPVNPFIEVGAIVQLSATVRDVRDATMTGVTVTWRSADSTIARVSSTGLVTGVSEDTTVITATAGNVSANNTIAVVRASVASVVVSPPTSSIKVGETVALTARTFDARGAELTGRLISWISTRPAIATVSSSGVVTGIAPGVDSVVATSEGKSGRAFVNVVQVPVDHVVVSPPTASLIVGQTAAFTATAYDAANNVLTGRTFIWETGDTAVVTVEPNAGGTATATATAAGPGYMFISARVGFVGDSAQVEVTGATVSCLRPWALPELWFLANPYGRAVRARFGLPNQFVTVPPGTISGNYYPVALGAQGANQYVDNVVTCSPTPVTLGAPNPLATGNLVGPTLTALDSLFNLDQGATWDSTANGGLGGIVASNAPPGAESPRVVLVGLYEDRDHTPGSSSVRFRRTAYVFVDTYARETNFDLNEVKGDIVFRFLRFGP